MLTIRGNVEPLNQYRLELRAIIRDVILIGALFFLNNLGAPGNAAFFAFLIYLSTGSHEDAVKALSLMFLVVVGNTALVDTGNIIFSILKLGFVLFIFARFALTPPLRSNVLQKSPLTTPLLVFCLVSFALALSGGYFVSISALKLVSFFAGAGSVFAAVAIIRHRPHQLDQWFFSMIVFIALVGIFTWFAGLGFNAKTGFARFDRFFNGPFYHPQTLGPASALIILWLFNFGVLSNYGRRRWALLLIPIFLGFIYLSSSRTSIATIGVSVAVSFVALLFARRASLPSLKKLTSRIFLAGAIASAGLVFLEAARPGSVLEPMIEFVAKSNEPEKLLQADVILASRRGLIDMMAENIEDKPLTGIGFGTSTHRSFVRNATWYRATTEKGFLPMAIVEETGAIGTTFFLILILAIFRYCLREGNVSGLAGFAALIGVNFGEMSFFSFGGHGGFYWMWVMALMLMLPPNLSAGQPGSRRHLASVGDKPGTLNL